MNVFFKCVLFLLSILGIAFIVSMAIDVYFRLVNGKFRRPYPWNDYDKWNQAIKRTAVKYLKNPPIVPSKDEKRFILYDIAKGWYAEKAVQEWHYAYLNMAVSEFDPLEAKKYYKLPNMSQIDAGVNIYNGWNSGFIMDDDIDAVMGKYLDVLQEKVTNDGLICFRSVFRGIYLVDTLAFVCPILVKYGVYKGEDRYIDFAMQNMKSYYKYGYLPEYHLYAHAYSLERKSPCESIGWGRGTGWFLLALTLCYKEMYEGDYKKWLEEKLIEGAGNILTFQTASGGWCTELVRQEHYDSSTTAIFGNALVQAYEITGNQKFLDGAIKGMKCLMVNTNKSGEVLSSEGDCHGLNNYSHNYIKTPFTQGMSILFSDKIKDYMGG